jgi:hypothetical protein
LAEVEDKDKDGNDMKEILGRGRTYELKRSVNGRR